MLLLVFAAVHLMVTLNVVVRAAGVRRSLGGFGTVFLGVAIARLGLLGLDAWLILEGMKNIEHPVLLPLSGLGPIMVISAFIAVWRRSQDVPAGSEEEASLTRLSSAWTGLVALDGLRLVIFVIAFLFIHSS